MRRVSQRLRGLVACSLGLVVVAGGRPALAVPPTTGGMDLSTGAEGTWGPLDAPLRQLVDAQLEAAGLGGAVTTARSAILQLESGRVPVLGALEDPFQGDVEAAMAAALDQSRLATGILAGLAPEAARTAFELLRSSPLVLDGELAFSTPISRTRLTRRGAELSLCTTVVGPAGSRVTIGISNGAQLCGVRAPRLANPGGALVAFADLAVGYTHVQTRLPLVPDLEDPFKLPGPLLQGETYVKIHDQWVQIRLAGADPETVLIDAAITVGAKGGINYIGVGEVEGTVTLAYQVRPFLAAEVIAGVATAIAAELARLQLPADTVLDARAAADVMVKAIDFLQQTDLFDGDALGTVQLVVGGSAQVGVGIWDTALNGASVGGNISTTVPIQALAGLAASKLEQVIRISLGVSDTVRELSSGMLGGTPEAQIEALLARVGVAAQALVQDALADLIALTADVEIDLGFEVSVLGRVSRGGNTADEAPRNITLIRDNVNVAIGRMAETLLDPVQLAAAVRGAVEAAARITMYTVGQAAEAGALLTDGIGGISHGLAAAVPAYSVPTPADFDDLHAGILDDVQFTLLNTGAPFTMVGVQDVSLGALLRVFGESATLTTGIVVGLVKAARSGSLHELRAAIELAAQEGLRLGLATFVDVLETVTIPLSAGFGGSVDLGAEGVVKLGYGGELEGQLKASLLLLMLDHAAYDEAHGTVLASLAFPMSVSLSAGASVGEAVEGTVDVGATLTRSLVDFSITHWEAELPPPPGMTVAGFEVFDFTGVVNEDESFAGEGFLMLPMGGIVHAWFDVDAAGHVVTGRWQGGFELGPLGKLTLAQGVLDDDGVRGKIVVDVLESSFLADFLLQSTGRLYGTYSGTLTIEGFTLADVTVILGEDGSFRGLANLALGENVLDLAIAIHPDGSFTGSYFGTVVLAGRTLSNVSLAWDGVAFTGTGLFDLFGNSATFGLTVGADGRFAGSYTQGEGEVLGFGEAGFSDVSLVFNDQDGVIGNATFSVPGIPAMQLTDVRIAANGEVTGRYTGNTSLAGFTTAVDLVLESDGLHGSGQLEALGSTFTASNLFIGRDGRLLGTFTGRTVIAGHTLSNVSLSFDGATLTGTGTTNLLGNTATFGLVIGNAGQVSGSYVQGAGEVFGIGGLGLSGVELSLSHAGVSGDGQLVLPGLGSFQVTGLGIDALGHATGSLAGSTSLFGFDTALALTLSETGLRGTGSLEALGSALEATDLSIDGYARVRGTFEGTLVSAGQTLSVSTLAVQDDRLVGSTRLDLPNVSQAQVVLTLRQGVVTARYETAWNLFGVGSALAEFTLEPQRILVHAEMQSDFIGDLRALVLGAITDTVATAQADLAFAQGEVARAQRDVDGLDGQIAAMHAQIEYEKSVARGILREAERLANAAWSALLGVGDAIAAVNREFAGRLGQATTDLQNARNAVGNARYSLDVLNWEIQKLDDWYWGQDGHGRFWTWLYYEGARATLVGSRDIAHAALWFADGILASVQRGLSDLQALLQHRLQPLLDDQSIKQGALNFASQTLQRARQGLESIPLDPELDPRIITLRGSKHVATLALNFADGFLELSRKFLGAIVDVANFIDQFGPAALLDIRSASFDAELGALAGGRVRMEADLYYMHQLRRVGFDFDFFDPVGSAVALSTELSPGLVRDETPPDVEPDTGWTDTVAPNTVATAPGGWQRGNATVTLRALDSVSGVASITFSAAGAQSIAPTVVAGDTATILVSADGETTVSYAARDRAGNVEATRSVVVRIDRSGAVATATAPQGWQKDRAEVTITATDVGSGVGSIRYGATGALTTAPLTVAAAATTIRVNTEGVTTITYAATDVAGNTGATGSVAVSIDRTAPVSVLDAPSGWLDAAAAVAVSASDAHSGVAAIHWSASGAQNTGLTSISGSSGTIDVTAPGVTTVTFYATDVAGNVELARTFIVQIDVLAPTITGSAPIGWQNEVVYADFTAVDEAGGSGVASITVSAVGAQPVDPATTPGATASVPITAEGVTTVSFSAADNAGNVSAVRSLTAYVDLTNPVTTAEAPSAWQNRSITVDLGATDNLSGVAAISYDATGAGPIDLRSVPGDATSFPVSAEGVTTVRYFSTDVAGNVEAAGTVVAKIDLTNPVTTATAPTAWQNRPVTVNLAATDNLSGVDFITYAATGAQPVASTRVDADDTTFVISAEGVTTITSYATDIAGNVEVAASITVRIDLTKPVITFVGGRTYTVDELVGVTCTTTDDLSGVASDTCAAAATIADAWTFALGRHTVTATATDVAGNVETTSTEFEVIVTHASLINLTRRWVTHAGTQNALVTKLEAAAAADARGNARAEAGQLGAYMNQLSATSGRRLTAEQAAVLTRLATALLAQ